MSFFSYKNNGQHLCPGRIEGDVLAGICDRACISVKKIYDACMQQEQMNRVSVQLTDVLPRTDFAMPLTFVSLRSIPNRSEIRDLCIDRLDDRPCFARVQSCIDTPCELLFVDAQGRQGKGCCNISIKKDVVMFVPDDAIVPFEVECMCNIVSVTGEYCGDFRFVCEPCVTLIQKIVAEVDLLVPTYGFCRIPSCESYAENVCDEFFSLPIFPQSLPEAARDIDR